MDFLLLVVKASIHHFLFLRHVYPARLFARQRLLGTFTQACRAPEVLTYITEVLASLKVLFPTLQRGRRCSTTFFRTLQTLLCLVADSSVLVA